MKKNSMASYDVLKFVASIAIACLLHYQDHVLPNYNSEYVINNKFLQYWATHANMFVEMFFMISGTLFARSTIDKIDNEQIIFSEYIKRRLWRLYPLIIISSIYMWFGNFIAYLKIGDFWEGGSISFPKLFHNITLGAGVYEGALNGPMWYTYVLIICSIIAFFITYKCKMTLGGWRYVFPIIIGIVMKTYLRNDPGMLCLARGLVSFFTGILLNYAFIYIMKQRKTGQYIIVITLFVILSIGIISEMIPFMDYHAVKDLYAYANFMIFPELLIILRYISSVNKICENKLCKYLGKISWSIYVWNYPILITLFILDRVYNISFFDVLSIRYIFFLIICHITVGIISHELLEKKFTNLIKKYLIV